ncbi:MAG: right-handed parallel beta-helix repeat-containing protein [Actinomycetota bacterium]|nr:right-handed parallel beta-helix repeat-containing protein [Actinomycetota bacterium]
MYKNKLFMSVFVLSIILALSLTSCDTFNVTEEEDTEEISETKSDVENNSEREDEEKPQQETGQERNTETKNSLSGSFSVDQIWSDEIVITGDICIDGDLTILPGTVIKFVVCDDTGLGDEISPDGYNTFDPTRLKSYEITHSNLIVMGKLTAKGTPDKRIIFTSAAPEPDYADWVGIYAGSDGSIIEYSTVEWSRNGIVLGSNTPNTIVRNNIIKYTFWGSISSGYSSAQIYNNEIWEAGHEGIDVGGGNPIIENNEIHNAHTGIVILHDSAIVRNNTIMNVGNGVYIQQNATPVLENNYVELAPDDSKLEWSYGDFSYVMFGDPLIKK